MIGLDDVAKAGRLLAVRTGADVRRYFEISAVKRLLCVTERCPAALLTRRVTHYYYYFLFIFFAKKRITMSFSRAPLKRFNDTFGKTCFWM